MRTQDLPRGTLRYYGALTIELTCAVCTRPYQPTRADLLLGREHYALCPPCRTERRAARVARAVEAARAMRRELSDEDADEQDAHDIA